jgi:hypothetical protein
MMGDSADHDQLQRALDLEQAIAAEVDSDRALRLVLEEARAITGARCAALGILDGERVELERFLASRVDAATERGIGQPHGGAVRFAC